MATLSDATKKLIEAVGRVEHYEWTQVQTNYRYNNYGRFIFETFDYEELLEKIEETIRSKGLPEDFRQYTINRWYNYITSLVICDFFLSYPRVRRCPERRNKQVDFFVDGKPFDLKVTFIPKSWSFKRALSALRDPRKLIIYYYEGMGADRAHFGAKIFFVMVDINNIGSHPWWMKREFDALERVVKLYLDRTKETEFFRNFRVRSKGSYVTVKAADAIFLIKKDKGFYYSFFRWKDNIPRAIMGRI
jgi:hypothetical protein